MLLSLLTKLPLSLINLAVMSFAVNRIDFELSSSDTDIYYTVPEIIRSRGFKAEEYNVTTEDGYILSLFRIVNPHLTAGQLRPRPVVMVHGLMMSATQWLFNRKGTIDSNGHYTEDNKLVNIDDFTNDCNQTLTSTLAFTLSACGWDVWLTNTRSNYYAPRHTNLSIWDEKYWNYSLTDIAIYDIPAHIERVIQETKTDSVSVIAVSMGTTEMFALLSLKPRIEQYVRPFIALAPVAFMANCRNQNARTLSKVEPVLRGLTVGMGLPRLLSRLFGSLVCGNFLLRHLCAAFNGGVYGVDVYNTDISRHPAIVGNSLNFISSRVLLHYAQFINTGRFALFNYGADSNMQVYGNKQSPDYPIWNITSKHIYLFQGLNDHLATVKDVEHLTSKLPYVKELRTIDWQMWTHGDFSRALHENMFQDVYILRILNNYNAK